MATKKEPANEQEQMDKAVGTADAAREAEEIIAQARAEADKILADAKARYSGITTDAIVKEIIKSVKLPR